MQKIIKIKTVYLIFILLFICSLIVLFLNKFGRIIQTNAAGSNDPKQIIDIKLPSGYTRIRTGNKSFKTFLRSLALKPAGSPVRLFDGTLKRNQDIHHSVIDIPVGKKDLQQCADAIMRLKAEYHFSCKEFGKIHFNLTNGQKIPFSKWMQGYRPKINNNRFVWSKRSHINSSHDNLLHYLDFIYAWAGSYSLSRELKSIDIKDINIGDIFIQGGFPGHAVIVVDMAVKDDNSNEKIYLLAQSYMPAQDIHILKNPLSKTISPWYRMPKSTTLVTPEWIFSRNDLKRFN